MSNLCKPDCSCEYNGYIPQYKDVPVCAHCGTPWVFDLGGLLRSHRELEVRIAELERREGIEK